MNQSIDSTAHENLYASLGDTPRNRGAAERLQRTITDPNLRRIIPMDDSNAAAYSSILSAVEERNRSLNDW